MTEFFPCLIDSYSKKRYDLVGNIITIGSSESCKICIKSENIPQIAAHLIFTQGKYKIQKIAPDLKITINNKILDENAFLNHKDNVCFEEFSFLYLEYKDDLDLNFNKSDTLVLNELTYAVISILRNQEDAATNLISSVAKILKCDAARLLEENPDTHERITIAKYPAQIGLERFSNTAIDFAKNNLKSIIINESDWKDIVDPKSSLERNLIASVLCAPLSYQDRILGYLYLDRLKDSKPFTQEEQKLCDSLLPLFSELLANNEQKRLLAETIARYQSLAFQDTGGIIYQSKEMAQIINFAKRLAQTDSPVLIYGETGTGKELIARFIHENSSRKNKPFKAINCGAIPETLIESELFGHEKGAFTGASSRKIGLFEAASGGTIFLDEIGELPYGLQVKLLRFLQDSEIVRLGGTESIKTDVRIVAATNKKLENEVSKNRFRQDLFFRLNVLTINLPPLRERTDDICLLAEYFVKKYCQQFGMHPKILLQSAKNVLISYNWPGNVRELENVIQKAILLSQNNKISKENIQLSYTSLPKNLFSDSEPLTLKEARIIAEKEIITKTLLRTNGNVSMASKILEIDRKWLIKLMNDYNINAHDFRKEK
jgi:transcriptional regulator with GAF, ATPase, and Fis domain